MWDEYQQESEASETNVNNASRSLPGGKVYKEKNFLLSDTLCLQNSQKWHQLGKEVPGFCFSNENTGEKLKSFTAPVAQRFWCFRFHFHFLAFFFIIDSLWTSHHSLQFCSSPSFLISVLHPCRVPTPHKRNFLKIWNKTDKKFF